MFSYRKTIMIGKLNRLPFIGEIFYGETTTPRDSKRMVIVYRNNTNNKLSLLVNNELINMNGYTENELLMAINASEILPDTCHFPTFNSDLEPKFNQEG